MNTSEFDKYKVDHLFLLIGENPLPNYVAARLLLNQGGIPYLVYTSWTEKQAMRLKTILDNELNGLGKPQFVALNEYESDAYHIQDEIFTQGLGLIKKGEIGLHYTGGTKAMSVHAYKTLFYEKIKMPDRRLLYQERSGIRLSYLDSRRLEMCIDREDGERIRLKVTPEVLPIKLGKVFQIHGWMWLEKSKPIEQPELPEAAQAFAEFHTNDELIKIWRTWCNEILREATREQKNKSKWKDDNKLKNIEALSLEKLKPHDKIKSALTHLGVMDEALLLQTVKEQGLTTLESACKWLDGEWLEHYVLQQVQKIPKEFAIHDSATSFWIKNPINPKNTKFQFDVAFMRGYQLFAISCTTIDRKFDCKSKLFEAFIRARQLGGDEARVALVCCVNQADANALETEIVNVLNPTPDSGKRDYKIAVFGRDDLLNLSERIAEWIRNIEKEASR